MMYEPIDKNELSINLNHINHKPSSPICPPSPLTPLTNHFNASSYSLFHTGNDYGWFSSSNAPLFRNHSTVVEDCAYKRITQNYTPVCSFCLDKSNIQQLFASSCGQHQFCHSCLSSQKSHLLLQGICPFCEQANGVQSNQVPLKSDSSFVSNYATYSPHYYPCVKLTNIPWDVSQQDVKQFFFNCKNPSANTYTQSIHIMMDRTTGKTLSDAYVEFATTMDMKRAIETKNQKPLKGRIVSVIECTQEELLSVVFPKWRGQFHGISAIPPVVGGVSGCPPFITREEINSLLVVCKNYKLHFSRKCAERPFENIISVITKHPWHQAHLFISTMHRDHIYEMLKLSIESLRTHLAKDYVQIDNTLLERLVRAGIMCPAFTERQKATLLQTARIECPQEITSYLVYPSPVVSLAPPGLQLSKNSEYSNSNNKGSNINVPSILFTPNSPTLNLPTGLKQSASPYHFVPQKTYSLSASQKEEPPYLWSKIQEGDKTEPSCAPSINSPVSSLIRDIHQYCHFNDTPDNKKQLSGFDSQPQLTKNGVSLLFQPTNNNTMENQYVQQKQSIGSQSQLQELYYQKQQTLPWTPSFTSKPNNSDIWRMPTSPTAEPNHMVASESVLIA